MDLHNPNPPQTKRRRVCGKLGTHSEHECIESFLARSYASVLDEKEDHSRLQETKHRDAVLDEVNSDGDGSTSRAVGHKES